MIKGFRGTSLVDYPGKISSVIFTYKCNFRCPYCFNIELILPEKYNKLEDLSEDWVLEELKKRKNFIKGVVITGGEPTLWGERLINFIEKIDEEIGLPIKLDTNGSNPEIVKKLLQKDIIDFWAIDFKTSPHKYNQVGGDFRKVEETLEMLANIKEKVEIRITLYPPLVSKQDLEKMLPYLEKFKYIALQKVISDKMLEKKNIPLYSQDNYEDLKNFLEKNLKEAKIIKRY